MLRDLVGAVKQTYSGALAKQHVAALSQFHRMQASPGFRAAAEYCQSQLCSWGVEAEVVSFPADVGTAYWACDMFQEWEASEAVLDLLLPEGGATRLADYCEDKISLIQRSQPFDGEAELVVLERGDSPEEYRGLEVAGRVVLANGDIREVWQQAVSERGAAGILFDGMRELPPVRQRIDLPDARQYTSFWWRKGDEPRGFGFVLTPRQGDWLRALARQQAQQGRAPLRVRAKVASRLYDGQVEVVSALLRGRTDAEAVVIAHLCHPQASANDNASGSAAALEAARALQALISSGRLARPERSIRFLWVPEMTGTYAYLATHEDELARMVAGINLDMVGEDQALCGSALLIERPPEAAAGFAGDLAEALHEAMQEGASNLAGTASYPLYRHAVTPFSGGSDHYILSDPTVGVPTPMLIQWPDKFYHTSADTIDKVDPNMLAVAGGLAASYAYFVAAAGEQEARWLAREMVARCKARLGRLAQQCYGEALDCRGLDALGSVADRAARRLAFQAERGADSLQALLRLAPGLAGTVEAAAQSIRAAGQEEWAGLRTELEGLARRRGAGGLPAPRLARDDEWSERARGMVLQRTVRGPVELTALVARLEPPSRARAEELLREQRAAARRLSVYMLHWIDGRRTLAEVADLVECEVGVRDVGLMVRLAELMVEVGWLEVRN